MYAHHALLDEKLAAAMRGQIPRLMVFMPPRHGKSELVSRYGTAWAVLELKKRVILASYEARFAAWWGMQARELAREYAPLYGERLSQLTSAQSWWALAGRESSASMMTAGVGGPITGKGGDVLLMDDPVKNAAEVASQTMRDSMWSWYLSTFRTRLQKGGSIILVMTRWHEDDIAGRLLKQMERGEGERWEVISLPAIAERDEAVTLFGGALYWKRGEGDALWPEMFDRKTLDTTREDVGGDVWSALYQQTPIAEGGAIWKREWLGRRYDYAEMLEAKAAGKLRKWGIRRIEQSVDGAWKEGVHTDYSVIATWGVTETDYVLLDEWRMRVEYPSLKRAIVEQAAKWNPSVVLIEDAASGTAALQELRKTTRLPVRGIHPDGSKISRAQLVTPVGEAGHILLPDSAEWVSDWVEEHVRFPKAPHDDRVDTTSMVLNSLRLARAGRLMTM